MNCVSQHETLNSCGLNSPEWIAAWHGLEASMHSSCVYGNREQLLSCLLLVCYTYSWWFGEVCPPAETRIRCSPALDIVLVSRLTLFQAAKSRYIAFGLGSLYSGRYHLRFQINKTLWRRFLILPERIMIVITKQMLYLTVKYESRLRSPAIVSFRWAFRSSCWDFFLEMILSEKQSMKRTWMLMDLFCAFLLIRLRMRPGSVFQLCSPEVLADDSAFPLPIQERKSVCVLIILLTRNAWKKLPYVILGWPEARMLIPDSRWFSVCPESILLLSIILLN